MITKKLAACSLAVVLPLAACSSDKKDSSSKKEGGSSESSGSSSSARAGTYKGTLEDESKLTVYLDVSADNEAVKPFEEYRQKVGGPDVTWIIGEVTPPAGQSGTGRLVTFLAEGKDILDDDPLDDSDGISDASFACGALDRWSSGGSQDQEVFDLYKSLVENNCAGQTFQVIAPEGKTTTYVLYYEGSLPDYDTIYAGITELKKA